MLWTGYIMSALPVLMLLMSAVMKLIKPPAVVECFAHLGLPESLALGLGIIELACAVAYVIPQTSVIDAILLTGYLGGETVAHLRVGDSSSCRFSLGCWSGEDFFCAIHDCALSFPCGVSLRSGREDIKSMSSMCLATNS